MVVVCKPAQEEEPTSCNKCTPRKLVKCVGWTSAGNQARWGLAGVDWGGSFCCCLFFVLFFDREGVFHCHTSGSLTTELLLMKRPEDSDWGCSRTAGIDRTQISHTSPEASSSEEKAHYIAAEQVHLGSAKAARSNMNWGAPIGEEFHSNNEDDKHTRLQRRVFLASCVLKSTTPRTIFLLFWLEPK